MSSVDREGGSGVGSGLVDLYLESTLAGELFTISRFWLMLGEEVSTESARPQMSKYQNTENKRRCYKKGFAPQFLASVRSKTGMLGPVTEKALS